eukprot:CAMPEP_0176145338 /NCGR_PEP_ID=MMETSP0120_2-20121206/74025_1 /TAXON_ID=160619 /ORGANISM="Kryptoperidinium foliaceum, Strain CCMP 1326" /LENGTH=69 /DNA_ID=CAMNT_0017481783 /DNA_START=113 /DNA_END=319 /DNA_ORIENTATION=-
MTMICVEDQPISVMNTSMKQQDASESSRRRQQKRTSGATSKRVQFFPRARIRYIAHVNELSDAVRHRCW